MLTAAQCTVKLVGSGAIKGGNPRSHLTIVTCSEVPMAGTNSTPSPSALLANWREAMRDCGATDEEIRLVEEGNLNYQKEVGDASHSESSC